jgi:hypothetical protein
MLRSKIRLAVLVVLPTMSLTAQSSFGGSTTVECFVRGFVSADDRLNVDGPFRRRCLCHAKSRFPELHEDYLTRRRQRLV